VLVRNREVVREAVDVLFEKRLLLLPKGFSLSFAILLQSDGTAAESSVCQHGRDDRGKKDQ